MPRPRKRPRRNLSKTPGDVPKTLPSSRLKRPRRLPEPDHTRPHPQPPTTLPSRVSVQLSKINNHCAFLCQTDCTKSDENNQLLDDVVRQCADLLPSVSVPSLLDNAPLLPQVLRRAMNAPNLNTEALTKCFIIFASQSPPAPKDNDPFAVDSLSDKDNLVTAAVDWALLMFLRCLSLTSNSTIQNCCRSHKGVLVGPRDEVRRCIIERLGITLTSALKSLKPNDSPSMMGVVNNMVNHGLCPLREVACALRCVLRQILDEPRDSPTKKQGVLLLCDLSELLIQKNGDRFDKLSLDDRADLLYASDHIYDWFVKRLKKRVVEDTSWECLVRETEAISIAAQKHITVHWKLMDYVRDALEARTGEFKVCWWRRQTWLRVALAQVVGELGAKEIGERVPPALKLCMRQTVTLVHALKTEENLEAGVKAAQLLYDGMRLSRRLVLARNEQAILLTFETLVVQALWACGVQMRTKGYLATKAVRIGAALAVACNVGRTVGGRATESKVQLRSVFDNLVTILSVSNVNAKLITTQTSNVYLGAFMLGCEGKGSYQQILNVWEQSWLERMLKV